VVPIGGGKPQPYVMYEYACREGDAGIPNSLRGTQVELAKQKEKAAIPASSTTSSLVGQTEAAIREKFGKPATIAGPRWEYNTTSVGDVVYIYFVGGKVTSVRPVDLPLDQIAKTP